MITIGIDGNEANVKKQVGVSVYAQNLLLEFNKKAIETTRFNIYLKNNIVNTMPNEKSFFKYIFVNGKFLWSQLFLPFKLLIGEKNDVFFSPAHYVPRFTNTPIIVTIHDLSYYYFPNEFLKRDLFKLKNWTKYSIHKAKKIIAVSENTKLDIIKFFGIPKEKIQVIYNGYEKKIIKNDFDKKLINRVSKNLYILYVGTLQPRKNIQTLIDAFIKFLLQNKNFRLVIAGKKGWLYSEIFKKVKESGFSKKIIFTDYVNNSTLKKLYQNAFCLVHPSLYEGFGIPLLEAMNEGCPIISSNTSSLPEIAGDAALFFEPKNVDHLVFQINNLVKHEDLKNTLIAKGKERVKLFSWKKCASETLKVIKSASNSK
ncbi:MAG: glycosyltransferase family 1 protein [bacterium]